MSERAFDRWTAVGVALYAVTVATALVLAEAHSLTRWADVRPALGIGSEGITYDDGFYYLKIAQEIARGAGSTFDGVNPTNGYHPLWLLCLVPIFWVTSAPEDGVILAVILQASLMSICATLTYRIARIDLGRFGAILAALLWVHAQLPYRTALSGMEYGLQATTVLAVIYVYRRSFADRAQPPRAYLALGILLALAFLARLDCILLFGCIGLALAWREFRAGFAAARIRCLLALILPVVAVLLLYLGANLWLFGHALPVSGVLKRDWSARLLAQDREYQAHGWLVAKMFNVLWAFGNMKHSYVLFLTAGSAGVTGLWFLCVHGRKRAASHPQHSSVFLPLAWFARAPLVWGSLVLFSVLQLSLFLIVYHDGYCFQRWYYVIQPWFGAMLLAAIAESTRMYALQSPPRFVACGQLAALISVVALIAVPLASARTIGQWRKEASVGFSREPLYAAAQWVRVNVPSTAVVGAWNAGIIGYLSERQVVNLDGRVNSWDFYQTKQYDLCQYWREANIDYLVDTFEIDRELAFINTFYDHGVDLSACFGQFDRFWIGPAYLGTSQHAMAFRRR